MLTNSKIELNYVSYLKRLEKYGCYSQKMIDDLGDSLKMGTFAMSEDSGACYPGSLIDVVLNMMCTLGYHINEDVLTGTHAIMKVNPEMLMRVLLLQHISKAVMFVPTAEEWKRRKGIPYDFNEETPTSLSLGKRTLFMCQEYGIPLSEEEYDAISVMDRENDDKSHLLTPLAVLVKSINSMVFVELRTRYRQTHKKEEMER